MSQQDGNVFKRKVSVYEEINFQRQPSLTFCRLHLKNWVKKVTAGTRQSIKTLGANLGWQSHNVTVAFQWDSEFSCSDRDSEVILIHIIHIYPLSKFFRHLENAFTWRFEYELRPFCGPHGFTSSVETSASLRDECWARTTSFCRPL